MGIFPPESGDTLFEVNAYAAQTKINAFVVADAFGTALLRRYGTELSNAEYEAKADVVIRNYAPFDLGAETHKIIDRLKEIKT